MNYRKEYAWANGDLGNKLLDIFSYIPLVGIQMDNVLNKRIEDYLEKTYSGEVLNSKINDFKRKSIIKENYHVISALLISVFFLQRLTSSEPKRPQEKLEGPSSLENVIKVIGTNENSHRTFNFEDYFT